MSAPASRIGPGEILVLVGGGAPSASMDWLRFDAGGREILSRGRTSGGAHFAGAQTSRTILVIPGSEAQLKRLEIAARTEVQARAAGPYLFEGALAAASGLHYAIGAAQDDAGNRLVAAIASERLREWIECCRAIGASPEAVFLDCTIWPTPEGVVEIIETSQLTIVAAGAEGGFAIEPSLAPAVTAPWLRQNRARVRSVNLAVSDPEAWGRVLGADAPPLRIGSVADPGEAIARAALEAPRYAPNLRQGEFALAEQTGAPWRVWRLAAALALLAVALQIGSLVTAGWRDAAAARQTLTLAERDFRAARPEVRRIVNLRAQAAALANELERAGNHPVLAVNDPLIRVLRSHPLVRLDELSHTAPARSVHLRLSAPQESALQQAAADLRRQGLKVESGDLLQVEGRSTTELVVESP